MKKVLILLIGVIIGVVISIYTLEIKGIKSEGKTLNNVGITISIFGFDFNYYYE